MRSIVFCCLLCLSGCVSNQTDPDALAEFSEGKDAKVFVNTLSASDIIEFSLEVNGRLQIDPTRVELNEDGMATFPLIGNVPLAGLTRIQAKARVAQAYRGLYVNPPMISFTVVYSDEADAWGYVTVLGRVNDPGRVAISSPEGIHLSEALKLAGGFSLGAKRDGVKVSRTDDTGEKMQCVIDFKRIADLGDASLDIELNAGDLVYVPERLF